MTDVKKPQTQHTPQPPEPMKKAGERVKDAVHKGKKGGANTMMGAAVGAAAGATIGGIAGAALADEKTRKTVTESISNIAKTAGETMKKLDENKGQLNQQLKDTASTVKKTAETVKDTTQPMHKPDTRKN